MDPKLNRHVCFCELPKYYYVLQTYDSHLSATLFVLGGMPNQMCPGNHKPPATPLAITEEATTPDNSQN